ncbi:uncharacterized protein [Heptranchias perlo]|uniref:uncharacterized protein isoform X2 n=1 Tax=Heptranchias perlo TaxID=212740 RepID=UPI00355A17DF
MGSAQHIAILRLGEASIHLESTSGWCEKGTAAPRDKKINKRREPRMHGRGRRSEGGPQHQAVLTGAEQEALEVSRTLGCPSVGDTETATQQTAGPSAAAVTTESDSSEELPASEGTSSHLSEPSTSADTHTSVGPRPHLVGVAHGESPHTCEHEQTPVARAAVESPHQWVHSSPGSAQLDADAQPWGPSFKRRMIEWQQHICEVLEEVPRALSAIAERMEESIGYGLNRDLGFMSRYT